jgi:hypothetical protein
VGATGERAAAEVQTADDTNALMMTTSTKMLKTAAMLRIQLHPRLLAGRELMNHSNSNLSADCNMTESVG